MEIGTDVVENDRFIKSIKHRDGRLKKRLFTYDELSSEYSNLQYAIIFSAKEAISKALKSGFNYGLSWHHININLVHQKIEVSLTGKAYKLANNRKILVTATQNAKTSSTVALLIEGE